MFEQLMELIEKNSGKLAAGLMGEIRKRGDAGPMGRSGNGRGAGGYPNRLGPVYEDLLNWLFDNLHKGNLIASSATLGDQTHLRGVPLGEIVTAILVIQREIMGIIIDELDAQGDLPLGQLVEIVFRVNLFFDLVMHSVSSGYHVIVDDRPGEGGGNGPDMTALHLG
jgi:hypothetical protein